MMEEFDTLALATGDTYEMVMDALVSAHPAQSPYPIRFSPDYICPIKKGGRIECVLKVDVVVDAVPGRFDEWADRLTADQYDRLCKYHLIRSRDYVYGKTGKYRFYICSFYKYADDYYQKNIQISKKLLLKDIPLV